MHAYDEANCLQIYIIFIYVHNPKKYLFPITILFIYEIPCQWRRQT